MRILIVNGYQKNQVGFKKFSEFQYIIMKILSEQKELVDTETEFFIRDKDNLDDFLYEIESSNLKKESANNFDQLDIVFVSGDMNVRPWSTSMRKVLTILRMCLRVNKYLYTCSWGYQALVFLCASNLEKNINVVNGNGNGSKLSEIHEMKKIINQIKQNDFFLDNTTGDLYGFNFETNEWIPKAQCGIHYRRSAEEFQSIGKFILKAPVYKANIEHKEKYTLFKSRRYEDLCTIKKIHLHHWLFEAMDSEFLVPLKNAWDTHTFAFINPRKKFTVLADSIRGPLVIELENIIGTQFDINPKYPNTLVPIKNYIHLALKYIKSGTSNHMSICNNHTLMKDSSINEILMKQKTQYKRKALKLLQERSAQMGFQSTYDKKQKMRGEQSDDEDDGEHFQSNNKNGEFKHVGYSAKKDHQPNVVTRNLVQSNKYKISGEKILEKQNSGMITSQNMKYPSKPKQVQILSRQNSDNSKLLSLKLDDKRQSAVGFVDMDIEDSVQGEQEEEELNSEEQRQQDMRRPSQPYSHTAAMQSRLKNAERAHTSFGKYHIYDPNNIQTLSKGAIRKKLHPRISSEYIKNDPLWIPGQLSQKDNNFKRGISQQSIIKKMHIPNHYSKAYGKKPGQFLSMTQNNTQSTLNKPPTRNGRDFGEFHTVFSGPWLSQEEIYKQNQKEEDKKIIGPAFKNKAHRVGYFSDGKFITEPNNILNYQFRNNDREKWVGGSWKISC